MSMYLIEQNKMPIHLVCPILVILFSRIKQVIIVMFVWFRYFFHFVHYHDVLFAVA